METLLNVYMQIRATSPQLAEALAWAEVIAVATVVTLVVFKAVPAIVRDVIKAFAENGIAS